jgi:hypothetical protein
MDNVQYYTHIINQSTVTNLQRITRDALETDAEAMQWRNNVQDGDNDHSVVRPAVERAYFLKCLPHEI